ncbi:MAG: FISUMP domain-containing protein, partial [Saprospiraceae bacterium]
AGTFNYSIPLTGGLGTVNATGTITVNLICGAYVATGVWKIFKCYNLGADESADPFTQSWKLNGHYYQWGRNTNITSGSPRYGAAGPTGSAVGDANAGTITDWSTTPAPNGAWADGSKTSSDPCPSGFRAPTAVQWAAVINTSINPTWSYVGTWSNNSTNYSPGLRIGSGTSGLFLPAAGSRGGNDGLLNGRGNFGNYWSSTENGSNNASSLSFGNGYAFTSNFSRTIGMSVRCIAE